MTKDDVLKVRDEKLARLAGLGLTGKAYSEAVARIMAEAEAALNAADTPAVKAQKAAKAVKAHAAKKAPAAAVSPESRLQAVLGSKPKGSWQRKVWLAWKQAALSFSDAGDALKAIESLKDAGYTFEKPASKKEQRTLLADRDKAVKLAVASVEAEKRARQAAEARKRLEAEAAEAARGEAKHAARMAAAQAKLTARREAERKAAQERAKRVHWALSAIGGHAAVLEVEDRLVTKVAKATERQQDGVEKALKAFRQVSRGDKLARAEVGKELAKAKAVRKAARKAARKELFRDELVRAYIRTIDPQDWVDREWVAHVLLGEPKPDVPALAEGEALPAYVQKHVQAASDIVAILVRPDGRPAKEWYDAVTAAEAKRAALKARREAKAEERRRSEKLGKTLDKETKAELKGMAREAKRAEKARHPRHTSWWAAFKAAQPAD